MKYTEEEITILRERDNYSIPTEVMKKIISIKEPAMMTKAMLDVLDFVCHPEKEIEDCGIANILLGEYLNGIEKDNRSYIENIKRKGGK